MAAGRLVVEDGVLKVLYPSMQMFLVDYLLLVYCPLRFRFNICRKALKFLLLLSNSEVEASLKQKPNPNKLEEQLAVARIDLR